MKFGFAFVGMPGDCVAYRRCYSGEGGWLMLSHGPLLKLLGRYLPCLGTEEFFELV